MGKGAAKTIFICEDDSGILEVIKIILEAENYQIEAYENGRNLAEAVALKQPDLLLLDLWMPEMNGPDFVKKLKDNPKTADVPVVLVSAATDLEAIAQSAGVPFLRKPFHIDDLLAVVKAKAR
ncbi:MAG TPA: response regulator [Candidatus Paceibacterota bacterium]|nr:response regulator [Candidatus Paceibacterota bacterium]